jgi:hypothetical protein
MIAVTVDGGQIKSKFLSSAILGKVQSTKISEQGADYVYDGLYHNLLIRNPNMMMFLFETLDFPLLNWTWLRGTSWHSSWAQFQLPPRKKWNDGMRC